MRHETSRMIYEISCDDEKQKMKTRENIKAIIVVIIIQLEMTMLMRMISSTLVYGFYSYSFVGR